MNRQGQGRIGTGDGCGQFMRGLEKERGERERGGRGRKWKRNRDRDTKKERQRQRERREIETESEKAGEKQRLGGAGGHGSYQCLFQSSETHQGKPCRN